MLTIVYKKKVQTIIFLPLKKIFAKRIRKQIFKHCLVRKVNSGLNQIKKYKVFKVLVKYSYKTFYAKCNRENKIPVKIVTCKKIVNF